MPQVQVDIKDTEHTVTRPIVFDIAHDLINAMGLPINTKIVMPGSQFEEDISVLAADYKVNPIYGNNTIVKLEVNENLIEDASRINIQKVDENKPLFKDEVLGIVVAPAYRHMVIELNLKFRFTDRTLAMRQKENMAQFATKLREGLVHEIGYQYAIPEEVSVILAALHRCRESQAPLREDFVDYLKRIKDPDITTATNISATVMELRKQEFQTRVMGRFDFDIVPEREEQEDNRMVHNLIFSYRVEYEKITGVIIKYPLMVHNVFLPDRFYDDVVPYQIGYRLEAPSRLVDNYDAFTKTKEIVGYTNGIPIPLCDDWQPKFVRSGIEGIAKVMVCVSPDDLRELFSLRELGYVEFKDEVLDYLTRNYMYLSKHGEALFTVALYEEDNLRDDLIDVDQDLVLTTKFDMDIRKTYRVFVTATTDLSKLSSLCIARLCADGAFTIKYLSVLAPKIISSGLLPKLNANGTIQRQELMKAIGFLRHSKHPLTGRMQLPSFRVGSFIIEASGA